MIDAARRAAQLLAAVETAALLMIAQHRAELLEARTPAAEQKRGEIGVTEQRAVRADGGDLPHPRAAHSVEHEGVERAERRGHARQEPNRVGREVGLRVEELVALAADGLELPE